jgi:hypothetical protein
MAKTSNKKKKKKKCKTGKQILKNHVKDLFPDTCFVRADDHNKLSGNVIDVAQPFLDNCPNFKLQKIMLSMAILAWNLAIVPEGLVEKSRDDMQEKLCRGDAQMIEDLDKVIESLIARKQLLYPEDNRIVINYHISETAGGYHLDVAFPVPESAVKK